MNLSALSLKQLEHIVGLLKEKEALQAKLDEINRDLQGIENGKVSAPSTSESLNYSPRSKRIKKRSRRRGGLQEAVLKVLKSAGAKGLTVKQLADQAKVKKSSLAVWLYTSGKKISGFKKVASGVFAYTP
jgi:predicted Zn-ribbon and HTH transcriptional regulator